MNIVKSSRHAKIAGDFGESLVLYWLSKSGFECARVDHTGIDLIANDPRSHELMGISVKTRTRVVRTEATSINLSREGFEKATEACVAFHCVPYYALVVDAGGLIHCYLLSLEHMKELAPGRGQFSYWSMSPARVLQYRSDPSIRWFELRETVDSW